MKKDDMIATIAGHFAEALIEEDVLSDDPASEAYQAAHEHTAALRSCYVALFPEITTDLEGPLKRALKPYRNDPSEEIQRAATHLAINAKDVLGDVPLQSFRVPTFEAPAPSSKEVSRSNRFLSELQRRAAEKKGKVREARTRAQLKAAKWQPFAFLD